MKKFLMLSVPVLVLALTVMLLIIPASAASGDAGYAVWNSEADYLANPSRPAMVYNTKYLTSNAYANRGYLLCYGDVEIAEETKLEVGQSLIIDLNGYTLTAAQKLKVNGDSSGSWNNIGSVTIKNGTVIHTTYQFIQPRPNSEIYFENCDIIEKSPSPSNSFIYDASSRIISFKNCTFTVEKGAKPNMISLANSYSSVNGDKLYRDENGKQLDYVRNVIFDNTTFVDNSEGNARILYFQSSYEDNVNVSFTNCSSFNTIGDNFITYSKDDVKKLVHVTLQISKSTIYSDKSIPFAATGYSYKLYDSIERVGHRVFVGNEVELLAPGEVQNPENPKLIFGASGNSEYPYQLCFNTTSVTWYDTPGSEGVTVFGIAEGAMLSRSATTRGYYFNPDDNNKVYNDVHVGWSKSIDGANPEKVVTVPKDGASYYAVFVNNPVSIVAFASSSMTQSDIIGGITGSEIDVQNMSVFKDAAYVYCYTDVTFVGDGPMVISGSFTFDLGGNTFHKSLVASRGSAVITVTGGNVKFINGKIASSMTSVADVEGGTLTFDGVDLSFDNVPAFYARGGKVVLNSSSLTQCTNNSDVPAFALAATSSATVEVNDTDISVKGPIAASLSSMTAPVSIYIGNSETVEASAVYLLHEDLADKYSGAEVSIVLEDVEVKSESVFDVATNNSGKPAMSGSYEIKGECLFTARPMAAGGTLTLPLGCDVVGIKDVGYTTAPNPVKMKFNAELGVNLSMNFYVPTSAEVTYAKTFDSETAKENLVIKEIDGVEYYLVSVKGISVADCLTAETVSIGFIGSDGKEYFALLEYSLTQYFEELLSNTDPLVRKLCASAMSYIHASYVYAGSVVPEDFAGLLNTDAYNNALRDVSEVPTPVSKVDRGNIGTAFTGAQLYLSSVLSVRFNLRDDFTGTLNLNGATYNVVDGKVGEAAHIDVNLSVLDLYRDKIVITGTSGEETISGAYSLSEYIASLGNGSAKLNDMLSALYAYCYEAYVYNNGGVLPPYVDHIPPVDVELK